MMSKLKLTDREYGFFKIKDLFTFITKSPKGLNNLEKVMVSGTNYLGATNRNNGVIEYVKDNPALTYKGNAIAFIRNGEGSMGYSVYKAEDFIATQDISVGYNENLNRYNGLFIVTIADKIRGKYNFGYKRNQQRLNNEILRLPITNSGNPDWQFMEDFIRQKEQAEIAKIKKYYANKAAELMIALGCIGDKIWKEFFFSDIFTEIQRGKRLTKSNQISGSQPYISSTASQNGVDNFIDNQTGVRRFENCLTLANSGSVGATFFQKYQFIASDHVTILKNEQFSKYVYLFLSGLINRLSEKYSFNREINDKRIQREKILLPTDNSGSPDWQFMHDFMVLIEQQKITELLKYYNKNNKLQDCGGGGVERLEDKDWQLFEIDKLFSVIIGKSIDGNKIDRINGKIVYITRKEQLNGLDGFIDYSDKYLNLDYPVITIGNETAEPFVQNYPFFTGTKVNILRPKFKANKQILSFIAVSLKQHKSKYSYSFTVNSTRLKKQNILLPVNDENQPDWAFMERYMQRLELEKTMQYLQYLDKSAEQT